MKLDFNEISTLLTDCESKESIQEIYEFGNEMVKECVERHHAIDAKATTIAGYSGAIVALLVSTTSFWKSVVTGWGLLFIFLGAIAALVAGAAALRTTSLKRLDWFSDSDWVPKKYLNNPEQLKRFHVVCMHNVIHSHEDALSTKSKWLKISLNTLYASAFLLMLALSATLCK